MKEEDGDGCGGFWFKLEEESPLLNAPMIMSME